MAEIRNVNPEVMAEQSKTLDSLIGQWRESVKSITALKQEMDSMWDGLANDQFNQRWEEDLVRYNNLTLVLDDYRRAIDTAVDMYTSCEEAVANIVKDN